MNSTFKCSPIFLKSLTNSLVGTYFKSPYLVQNLTTNLKLAATTPIADLNTRSDCDSNYIRLKLNDEIITITEAG